MLKYMIVREIAALSEDGKKQFIVKLVLNREQHTLRIQRRMKEILKDKYTGEVSEAIRAALQEIEDDYESEKMKFA